MPSLLFDDPPNTGILGLPAPNITPPDDRTVSQGDALAQVYRDVMERVARERQVSAERGLWDDETGRPTARGLLDAGQQYGNALLMGTTAPGVRAFHASPYSFERFDSSKIGTGQGAQAYGHGLYAAESPAVSGGGGQYDLEFTAKNLGKSDLNQQEMSILRGLREGKSDLDLLREQARMGAGFEEAQAAIDRVKAAKASIYEVNIGADPETFLHWDKPLSEQSAIVQAKIRNLQARNVLPKGWTPDDMATLTGRDLHQELRHVTGSDAKSAALLGEHVPGMGEGVPGIRYLDQGSRGAGEGSHNYVVFDAATLDILRKYGLAGLMAGGAATGAVSGNNQ